MKQTRREFVRVLFVATQAAVAGPLISGCVHAQSKASALDGINFLVFGDWGIPGKEQIAVANEMAKAAKDLKPRFVISVGDNFYWYGVTSTEDTLWKSTFEDVYSDSSLQIPWHAILGNHDYRG